MILPRTFQGQGLKYRILEAGCGCGPLAPKSKRRRERRRTPGSEMAEVRRAPEVFTGESNTVAVPTKMPDSANAANGSRRRLPDAARRDATARRRA